MRQAANTSGPNFPAGVADQISIELRNSSTGALVYALNNVNLTTAGNVSVNIPAIYNGSYYIYIRHRNSIATATATPVSFSGSTISRDFSTGASQAFGSNQQLMVDGMVAFYAGDVDQDGTVDISDMTQVDNDASDFAAGYLVTDLNGDGNIDIGDMTIVDNNAANFVNSVLPF